MKRILAVVLAVCLCAGLAGCGGDQGEKDESESSQSKVEAVETAKPTPSPTIAPTASPQPTADIKEKTVSKSLKGIEFEVPESWTEKAEEDLLYYYPADIDGKKLMVMVMRQDGPGVPLKGNEETYFDSYGESFDDYAALETKTMDAQFGDNTYTLTAHSYTLTLDDSDYMGVTSIYDTGANHYIFTCVRPVGPDTQAVFSQYTNMVTNCKIEKPAKAEEESSESAADAATAGQSNALKKAKSYLKFSQFSYEGLIGQLEYEKFSHEDAVYAVDNCGADWNEQALGKAKSYLDFSAFSYSGLISQLEYEKFTTEQATYGADNCGADWNEQAVKKGESYLKYSSFSRDGLIDQLIYEGFTDEQAAHSADENGL